MAEEPEKYPNAQDSRESTEIFEQILEVMPHDQFALRMVYLAHFNRGDREKAFEYLKRAAETALTESGDDEFLEFVRSQAAHFEDVMDEESRRLWSRLEEKTGAAAGQETAPGAPQPRTRGSSPHLDAEMNLAWRLYRAEQIDQSEYSDIVHDLAEMANRQVDVPTTVLHVISDRGFSQLNRIMQYLVSESGTPYIALPNFDIPEELTGLIPEEFPARRGLLPFAEKGNELMVAVLNPFNGELLAEAEVASGRRCHPFLVDPQAYDEAVARLKSKAEA
ncbi:hypothetical protein [Kiritimatiella glycovorans]|nr:hypothetical protein [Kiritimatiella glycovorans]